jgi:hypothetical protein
VCVIMGAGMCDGWWMQVGVGQWVQVVVVAGGCRFAMMKRCGCV